MSSILYVSRIDRQPRKNRSQPIWPNMLLGQWRRAPAKDAVFSELGHIGNLVSNQSSKNWNSSSKKTKGLHARSV
jgi:hypothetical protein